MLSKFEIEKSKFLIQKLIHNTPIMTSHFFDKLIGGEVFFKCENFQKAGAFKYRGASNAVLNLTNTQKKKGVITHSSGNHGQSLAFAAGKHGIKAHIVLPSNAPKVKSDSVSSYGAKITFCDSTLEARKSTVEALIKKYDYTEIHPFDNENIIAGQATVAMELIEQIPELDVIIAPVGGGGLLSGTALSAHYFSKGIEVYGAEPEMVDDAKQSFDAGKLLPNAYAAKSIADGLLASLSIRTFTIIQRYATDIITVSEEEIMKAMRLILERMKIIVEPSSAVAVAAVLKKKTFFKTKKIGVILSGGNVDLERLKFL